MENRKYYAARNGLQKSIQMDFLTFKKVFLHIFKKLEENFIFREATGYYCVDEGNILGIWGNDIEAHIFLKLRMDNIWPIHENIEAYDEPTLFTIIEFLYDYASEPQSKHYHDWNGCGYHTYDYDKEKGRDNYRNTINEILKEYDKGYQLSTDGEIIEIAPTGLEHLIEETPQTEDPDNLDNRFKIAITKYLRYGATIDEKKDAIRSLADVLEYLRKDGCKLESKDDDDLFKIINGFDIRHHHKFQHGDYEVDIWYDWFFYTFLSSIYVLLKLNKKSNIHESVIAEV